jgi:DnaJ homolog subfamily C member 9
VAALAEVPSHGVAFRRTAGHDQSLTGVEVPDARIRPEDIDAFRKTFQGSDEEKTEICQCYAKSNGDVEVFLSLMMLSTEEDMPRYREIVRERIAAGELVEHAQFFQEPETARKKRVRRAAREVCCGTRVLVESVIPHALVAGRGGRADAQGDGP